MIKSPQLQRHCSGRDHGTDTDFPICAGLVRPYIYCLRVGHLVAGDRAEPSVRKLNRNGPVCLDRGKQAVAYHALLQSSVAVADFY